jgi:hypothetical protein
MKSIKTFVMPALFEDEELITNLIAVSSLEHGSNGGGHHDWVISAERDWLCVEPSRLLGLLRGRGLHGFATERRIELLQETELNASPLPDDKCVTVFLEWCDEWGYESLELFQMADEGDIASIPLTSEQIDRVLSLLQDSDPAAWHPSCKRLVRQAWHPLQDDVTGPTLQPAHAADSDDEAAAPSPQSGKGAADTESAGAGAGTTNPSSAPEEGGTTTEAAVEESEDESSEKERRANDRYELAASNEEFVCPISQDVMKDPVVAADGQTYERRCIEEHFDQHGRISPMTNAALDHAFLNPNNRLRSQILHALEFDEAMTPVAVAPPVIVPAPQSTPLPKPAGGVVGITTGLSTDSDRLQAWLVENGFEDFSAGIQEEGVEKLEHLIDVTLDDLIGLGMKKIQARRLLRLALTVT